ncbi:MAG: DUF349 domain-containing protein [Bacteroidota bacterium]|nr:DUF349 domain-containing protein [Bacteroidota bacterium]
MDTKEPDYSVRNEQFAGAQNASETKEENLPVDSPEKSEKNQQDTLEVAAADLKVTNDHDVIPEPGTTNSQELKSEKDEIINTEEEENIDPDNVEEQADLTDYSGYSEEELVKILSNLVSTKNVEEIRKDVESIKVHFYKKHKAKIEQKRKEFVEGGGQLEDFKVEDDPSELAIKEIFKKYKELKSEFNKKLEEEKQTNLATKYKIIDDIKELINRKESINQTFQEFRELQKKWHNIGLVPQQNMNNLWESYHHTVEMFYDFIKINKELRDLDFRKNIEAKIGICEKVEELLLEPSVVKAFNQLQKFHEQWREIGPVAPEMREAIWERLKEATAKINKRHQEYFEELKESQKKNLESKTVLCEKIEEINNLEINNHVVWDEKTKEIIEIQKLWKTIGFAPKKENNKIYLRFRNACDIFFSRKRDFYAKNKEVQTNNLQLKTDLCIQAEALQNSTEWKKTTEDLINLQKRWKEIGPVPRKYSDTIWKRFRAACDIFFKNKAEYFSGVDSKYEENKQKKLDLISRIGNYQLSEKVEENFDKLKEFQREWSEIGYVALRDKEEIQTKYRESINKLFDSLKIDESKKNLLKFKNKIDNLSAQHQNNHKLNQERDKFMNRLSQLQNDIVTLENNIGFFAKTKNAESMINEVNQKIENSKKEIKMLKEKIKMIDNLDIE